MNILLELYNDLAYPFYDFDYIATGKVRASLRTAYQAWENEKVILEQVRNHAGAEQVTIASPTERKYWNGMNDAGGFKLYFKKYDQPEGWEIPESWGERQRIGDAYVYMPPQGSEIRSWLLEKSEDVSALLKESGLPTSKGVEYLTSSGWHYWQSLALFGENLNDKLANRIPGLYASALSPSAFLLHDRSRDKNYSPPEKFAECPRISKSDIKWLEKYSDRAALKSDRAESGKAIRTWPDMILGFF